MKPLLKSVAILSLLSLATRVMGFIFKIYLSRELGGINIGIYQVALSIFFVLVTCTCSGIPLVVGKLVARHKADYADYNVFIARKKEGAIVSSGIVIGLSFAIIACILLLGGSSLIKQAFASPESFVCLLLLLPALIASTISASVRGALWGRGLYNFSSIIEIIEQLIRIGLCVIVFNMGVNKLLSTAWTFSIAVCLSTIICIVYYFKKNGQLNNPREYLIPLLKQSTPITTARLSSSVVNMLVAFTIPFLFQAQGKTVDEGLFLLGASIGMAFPLLFTPNTFVGSLAYIILPDVASMYANKNKDISKRIENAISVSIMVAASFVPIFLAIGKPAGLILFENSISADFVVYSAWILLPLGLESIVSSMTNALELELKGLLSYFIGVLVMFSICFAFYGNFDLKVFSIAFGLSLTTSSIIDLIFIKNKIGLKFNFLWVLLLCISLIFPTWFITQSVYNLSLSFATTKLSNTISIIISLLISCTIGLAFYILALYIFDFCNIIITKNTKKIKLKKYKSKPA